MIKKSKDLRRLSLLLGLVLLGLLLPICLYLARGWIRGPLVSWYVDSVYLPKIEQSFTQDFAGLDAKLSPFDITFRQRNGMYLDTPKGCHEPMYGGLGISTYCYKSYFNDNPGPEVTDDYRRLWQTKSQVIEDHMLATGWKKTWNAAQPITELLIRDDRNASVGVNYEKRHGKITCKLSIWYNGSAEDPAKRELNTQKSCARYIDFFGGY